MEMEKASPYSRFILVTVFFSPMLPFRGEASRREARRRSSISADIPAPLSDTVTAQRELS